MSDKNKATKERGVIFNAEMVRAILAGRKTQTRRVMKVQPVLCGRFYEVYGTEWNEGVKFVPAIPGHSLSANCPFGSVGDRLWVRETWADAPASAIGLTLYRANYPEHVPSHCDFIPAAKNILWKPSIHMPRRASRITLEITSVRVERLNDISQEDAQAEGMELTGWRPDSGGDFQTPYDSFVELWRSIYGAGSWLSNPWVWVIEFRALKLAL
ncbi:hypothetical protein [Klebsiella sp. BIGb0407]|uniref:hypothetical protein n=1 Tax=Klebsiella sp. BIGb0407 TaxID=2940603 RepID=UPI00216826B5|nr:hypothetical protein [Klebsiella sp. BIGb0407]MCS3430052.1 uncharacterized protein YqfB (UPF0267 family) [Klebsiella sp. BIGb0407]